MTNLKLDDAVLAALVEACRREYPKEACGLLGGRDSRALSHYPITNVAGEPELRFEMDPMEQLDAFNRMQAKNEKLVAIYHSHPRTPPVPSSADIREAYYPGVFYVIVGLGGVLPQIRAFRLDRERGRAVEIRWLRVRGLAPKS